MHASLASAWDDSRGSNQTSQASPVLWAPSGAFNRRLARWSTDSGTSSTRLYIQAAKHPSNRSLPLDTPPRPPRRALARVLQRARSPSTTFAQIPILRSSNADQKLSALLIFVSLPTTTTTTPHVPDHALRHPGRRAHPPRPSQTTQSDPFQTGLPDLPPAQKAMRHGTPDVQRVREARQGERHSGPKSLSPRLFCCRADFFFPGMRMARRVVLIQSDHARAVPSRPTSTFSRG